MIAHEVLVLARLGDEWSAWHKEVDGARGKYPRGVNIPLVNTPEASAPGREHVTENKKRKIFIEGRRSFSGGTLILSTGLAVDVLSACSHLKHSFPFHACSRQ